MRKCKSNYLWVISLVQQFVSQDSYEVNFPKKFQRLRV